MTIVNTITVSKSKSHVTSTKWPLCYVQILSLCENIFTTLYYNRFWGIVAAPFTASSATIIILVIIIKHVGMAIYT
jgi:hypothetical protein